MQTWIDENKSDRWVLSDSDKLRTNVYRYKANIIYRE